MLEFSNKPRTGPPPFTAHLVEKPRRPWVNRQPNHEKPENWAFGAVAVLVAVGLFLGMFYMLGIFSTPIHAGTGKANEDAAVKTALTISLAMKDYSLDHQGLYPNGGTSTEVFQKLIDGKYVTDPAIFF